MDSIGIRRTNKITEERKDRKKNNIVVHVVVVFAIPRPGT
jgi:hypothetical protein